MTALSVKNLHASVGEVEILKGVSIDLPFGEIHAIMGPNGSGKSTLCHVLTGKSDYDIAGSATLDGEELLGLPIDVRARMGLMQAFQYPVEVAGVALDELIREAGDETGIAADELAERVATSAVDFDMTRFLNRSVNMDLSGGEKKRSEIFQLAVLKPKVAVLDEIDSGLDIDAVRDVSHAVEAMRGPDVGVLMITHYSRILRYLHPDRIHVMLDGRIVDSGGPELAEELEKGGYKSVRTRLGIEKAAADTTTGAEFLLD
jgi:Fe-S cluster assembly ATP-binding protein